MRAKRPPVQDSDSVDRLVDAWHAAVPSFETASLEVFGRIQHLARFYEQALADVGASHGLIPSDVYALLALRRSDRLLNAAELTQELSVTASAVTKRVDRLVESGFVERHPDAADGRGVKVALTARGRRMIDEEVLFSRRFPFRSVHELSKTERSELTTLLRRLLSLTERRAGDVGPKGALPKHRATKRRADG